MPPFVEESLFESAVAGFPNWTLALARQARESALVGEKPAHGKVLEAMQALHRVVSATELEVVLGPRRQEFHPGVYVDTVELKGKYTGAAVVRLILDPVYGPTWNCAHNVPAYEIFETAGLNRRLIDSRPEGDRPAGLIYLEPALMATVTKTRMGINFSGENVAEALEQEWQPGMKIGFYPNASGDNCLITLGHAENSDVLTLAMSKETGRRTVRAAGASMLGKIISAFEVAGSNYGG